MSMRKTDKHLKQMIRQQLWNILRAASAAVVVLSDWAAGRDPASVSAACAQHQHESGHWAGLPVAAAGLHSRDHSNMQWVSE